MRIAGLWSGGKESCLACHKVTTQGYDVAYIVTLSGTSRFFAIPSRSCHFSLRFGDPASSSK